DFCGKTSEVVYGNGVLTTFDEAVDNLNGLSLRLRQSMPDSEFSALKFDIAYNKTGGFLQDLLESVIQDLETDFTEFWRIMAGLDFMPDSFVAAAQRIAVEADSAAVVINTDLQRHIAFYQAKILEGKKVVLVSHSQGNFFANQAFPLLTASQKLSFGIVSVANPDSFVADGGLYTTLLEDLVVAAVRLAKEEAELPTPLVPNATNI